MSSLDARRDSRRLGVCVAFLLTGSLGCWEQWSNDWFPQMKRQRAVQAFEEVTHRGQMEGFTPPEGTVPVGGSARPYLAALTLPAQDALFAAEPEASVSARGP